MRKFLFLAIFIVSIAIPPSTRADCTPFTCWDDATDHTSCEVTYCSPLGGCDQVTYWAISCRVACDRLGGETQCWCHPLGECMMV